MTQSALHPRQRQVLEFVARALDRAGVPPTVRQIGAAVGIPSTSVVVYHLDRLAIAGLLVRDDRTARGLTVTDAGYAALGRVSPAVDAALGAALRDAALRSPSAAAVLRSLAVA